MNLISRHIEYLVRCHDCVIVPGWGAFIAQYQPASLVNNLLTPPSRTLVFNPSLTHDDGLLASSIVRQTGIGYENALKQISEEVNAMRHQLKVHNEVALSNIGSFHHNSNGSMIFEPFNKTSAEYSFFGLRSINLTPILSQAQVQTEKENGTTGKKDTIYVPIRRSWTRIAASIAIILGLGVTLSTPIVNDQAHTASVITTPTKPKIKLIEPAANTPIVLNVGGLDSTDATATVDTLRRKQYQQVMAYYKQREERRKARQEAILKQIEETRKRQEALLAQETTVSNADKNPTTTASKNTPMRFEASDAYCVVVASLTSRAQAEQFIASTGNKQLAILEKEGKFRVYAATGQNANEAYRIARSNGLLKRYRGAWVCKK